MNNKPKFKKSYINPSLGYWEDKNKPIEIIKFDPFFTPDMLLELECLKRLEVTRDTTDHLCIGKRCLICETRNLVNPFESI